MASTALEEVCAGLDLSKVLLAGTPVSKLLRAAAPDDGRMRQRRRKLSQLLHEPKSTFTPYGELVREMEIISIDGTKTEKSDSLPEPPPANQGGTPSSTQKMNQQLSIRQQKTIQQQGQPLVAGSVCGESPGGEGGVSKQGQPLVADFVFHGKM